MTLLAAVLLASLPVLFGIVRAVTTGSDFRYLWLAAAAILGSVLVMAPRYRSSASARFSLGRAVGAVVSGAACAAATAILLGAKAGPGIAIVAGAFGFCTGIGAALGAVARRTGPN